VGRGAGLQFRKKSMTIETFLMGLFEFVLNLFLVRLLQNLIKT
jgi:hypothetical protein